MFIQSFVSILSPMVESKYGQASLTSLEKQNSQGQVVIGYDAGDATPPGKQSRVRTLEGHLRRHLQHSPDSSQHFMVLFPCVHAEHFFVDTALLNLLHELY